MRGFRIGGFAAVGVVSLGLFTPAPSPRPLELHAPPEQVRVGVVSDATGASLVRLNAVSLKRLGRPLALNGFGGVWAFSPDGRVLAMAVHPDDNNSRDTLRFYSSSKLRRARPAVALGGSALTLAWVRSDRMLAYVNESSSGTSSVVVIDPRVGRTVARVPFAGTVLHVARTANALVFLVGDTNRIGPSRLVVVDGDGVSRTAALDAIVAGTTWPADRTSDPIGTRQIPALAVDDAGGHAFVIATDGTAVDVDLRSLAVSVHRLSEPHTLLERLAGWLTPRAEAKGMNGPVLSAEWLGDGLLAISGTDESAALEGGQFHASSRPTGLRIVDTHDWSARMLDSGADAVAVADDLLLATGSSWSSDSPQTGIGVAAYGHDRTQRFHVFAGRAAWVGFVYHGRVYVSVHDESALRIVDLASGRIVGRRSNDAPWPLLGDAAPAF